MTLEFNYLADHEDAIPTIAQWHFDQWGHLTEGETIENKRTVLREYLNRDKIPFMLLAIDQANSENNIMGVAQLKVREMGARYQDYEYWLGGVYVPSQHRGSGIASKLANEIVRRAKAHCVEALYLQTERLDGGFYARLGWQPVEKTFSRGRDVLVMKRGTGNESSS